MSESRHCDDCHQLITCTCGTCHCDGYCANGEPSAPLASHTSAVTRLPEAWRDGARILRSGGDVEKAEWAESYAAQLEACLRSDVASTDQISQIAARVEDWKLHGRAYELMHEILAAATLREQALKRILEIAYSGHPDGRETRLEVIARIAREALRTEEKGGR